MTCFFDKGVFNNPQFFAAPGSVPMDGTRPTMKNNEKEIRKVFHQNVGTLENVKTLLAGRATYFQRFLLREKSPFTLDFAKFSSPYDSHCYFSLTHYEESFCAKKVFRAQYKDLLQVCTNEQSEMIRLEEEMFDKIATSDDQEKKNLIAEYTRKIFYHFLHALEKKQQGIGKQSKRSTQWMGEGDNPWSNTMPKRPPPPPPQQQRHSFPPPPPTFQQFFTPPSCQRQQFFTPPPPPQQQFFTPPKRQTNRPPFFSPPRNGGPRPQSFSVPTPPPSFQRPPFTSFSPQGFSSSALQAEGALFQKIRCNVPALKQSFDNWNFGGVGDLPFFFTLAQSRQRSTHCYISALYPKNIKQGSVYGSFGTMIPINWDALFCSYHEFRTGNMVPPPSVVAMLMKGDAVPPNEVPLAMKDLCAIIVQKAFFIQATRFSE